MGIPPWLARGNCVRTRSPGSAHYAPACTPALRAHERGHAHSRSSARSGAQAALCAYTHVGGTPPPHTHVMRVSRRAQPCAGASPAPVHATHTRIMRQRDARASTSARHRRHARAVPARQPNARAFDPRSGRRTPPPTLRVVGGGGFLFSPQKVFHRLGKTCGKLNKSLSSASL